MSSYSLRSPLTEREMQLAEREIPRLAAKAGRHAYLETLRDTGAVTAKEQNGQLVKRQLDGTVTFIKKLPTAKRVKLGTVLKRAK